jgi:hypothetical protein
MSALEVASEASLFVEENGGLAVCFARWDDVALKRRLKVILAVGVMGE